MRMWLFVLLLLIATSAGNEQVEQDTPADSPSPSDNVPPYISTPEVTSPLSGNDNGTVEPISEELPEESPLPVPIDEAPLEPPPPVAPSKEALAVISFLSAFIALGIICAMGYAYITRSRNRDSPSGDTELAVL